MNDIGSPQSREIASIPPERVAVLVIHGMGAAKPYQTLDQFARGVKALFGREAKHKYDQTLKFRQHPSSPTGQQKDWTQAFVRLSRNPDSGKTNPGPGPTLMQRMHSSLGSAKSKLTGKPKDSSNQATQHLKDFPMIVDLFEYYWAPIVTGRVSAKQSLKFLILSSLTPFHFLRDNLIAMNQANATNKDDSWIRILLRGLWLLGKELYRALFLYIPLCAVFGLLYVMIAEPVLNLIAPAGDGSSKLLGHFFTVPQLTPANYLLLGLCAVRYLMLAMISLYLLQQLFVGNQGDLDSRIKRILGYYFALLAALLLVLLALPLLLGFCRGSAQWPDDLVLWVGCHQWWLCWRAAGVAALFLAADNYMALKKNWLKILVGVLAALAIVALFCFVPCLRSLAACLGHGLADIPPFVKKLQVGKYALLSLLLYFVNQFLTTAIGDLVVYLGADDLSQNFAARSQILDECTHAVGELLGQFEDLLPAGSPKVSLAPRYDRILIAAHSLGTVIAYDTLNELLVRNHALPIPPPASPTAKLDLARITGLLTFGCPLNKVYYFFRTRTSCATKILDQILYALHPFRLKPGLSPEDAAAPPTDLDKLKWINVFSSFDIISGRMFFYRADENERQFNGIAPWTAHTGYWDNEALYDKFSELL